MSVLSDRSIRAQLDSGRLHIDPLEDGAIQPASVDLRLGPVILVARRDGSHLPYDLSRRDRLWLNQGDFALGATLEAVVLPDDLSGQVAGRSTRARTGLIVESAGFVDPGWSGMLTLEMANLSPCPVELTLGMPICQIVLSRMTGAAERPYGHAGLGSHYQGSIGPVTATRGPS